MLAVLLHVGLFWGHPMYICHVIPAFSYCRALGLSSIVDHRNRTWVANGCSGTDVGRAAIRLLFSDPRRLAERNAQLGQYDLMAPPELKKFRNERNDHFPGWVCDRTLRGISAPGQPSSGHGLTACQRFNVRVQWQFAFYYNSIIAGMPGFPHHGYCRADTEVWNTEPQIRGGFGVK